MSFLWFFAPIVRSGAPGPARNAFLKPSGVSDIDLGVSAPLPASARPSTPSARRIDGAQDHVPRAGADPRATPVERRCPCWRAAVESSRMADVGSRGVADVDGFAGFASRPVSTGGGPMDESPITGVAVYDGSLPRQESRTWPTGFPRFDATSVLHRPDTCCGRSSSFRSTRFGRRDRRATSRSPSFTVQRATC